MSGWQHLQHSVQTTFLPAVISLSFAISFEIGAVEELQALAIIFYSIKTQLLEPDSLPGIQEDKEGPSKRKARTWLCDPLEPQTAAQLPPTPQEWAINAN